jgi:hypothetical protein
MNFNSVLENTDYDLIDDLGFSFILSNGKSYGDVENTIFVLGKKI